jgi:hypothetical protein
VGRVRAIPPLCLLYPDICHTTEDESTEKNLSLVVPVGHDSMCRQHSLLQVARTSCRSRSPFFTEPGSTLGQRRYLPSCVTKGSTHQLTLSRISQRYEVVGKERDSQIIVNLLVTNVPRCNGGNSKTLGLKHLPFPEMGACGGTP